MLYTWNKYNIVCQIYFSKKKKKSIHLCNVSNSHTLEWYAWDNVTFSDSQPFNRKYNFRDHSLKPHARPHKLLSRTPRSLWHCLPCPSSSLEWSAETQSPPLPGRSQNHPQSCWTQLPRWGVAGHWLLFSVVRQLLLYCFCSFKKMNIDIKHL